MNFVCTVKPKNPTFDFCDFLNLKLFYAPSKRDDRLTRQLWFDRVHPLPRFVWLYPLHIPTLTLDSRFHFVELISLFLLTFRPIQMVDGPLVSGRGEHQDSKYRIWLVIGLITLFNSTLASKLSRFLTGKVSAVYSLESKLQMNLHKPSLIQKSEQQLNRVINPTQNIPFWQSPQGVNN